MKLAAITLIIGIAAGAWVTDSYHFKKQARYMEEVARAEEDRAKRSKMEVDRLHEEYKKASNDNPVVTERVVTKRMFIRSECPVRESGDGSVDTRRDEGIVRLGAEADRSVREVIQQAEADYKKVKSQLQACLSRSGYGA